MDRKGRRVNGQLRGEQSASAKLTEDAVRFIRARYAAGDRSKDLAKMFGISVSYAWEVATGKTWRHVA
jgi:hypothetical protein